MKVLKLIYQNNYSRITFKFLISFTSCKVAYDWAEVKLKHRDYKIPRIALFMGQENALNPTFPQPYPYPFTYEHLQDIKSHNRFINKIYRTHLKDLGWRQEVLVDYPLRENPDFIDHLINWSQFYRYDQLAKYELLAKMNREGVTMPQNMSQRLRQLEQWTLDLESNVIPQL